jgi:stearoyl-CoA desaturase (delta-9 desaturase)
MCKEYLNAFMRWIDSEAGIENLQSGGFEKSVDWLRIIPFVVLHLGCLGVFWVGWSPVAVWTALVLYLIRMFAITGFYRRYFSHKAFNVGRGGTTTTTTMRCRPGRVFAGGKSISPTCC